MSTRSRKDRKGRKDKVSPEEAWEAAFLAVDHAPLLARLGAPVDPELLRLALTHRSFANEHDHLPNNERLEFVGDAVLGLSVANELFDRHPSRPESDLSPMRSRVVSRYALADVAREIGLGDHILLGKGEEVTGGRAKESILADTTEALLGAIYRQNGFEVTRAVILRLFAAKIDAAHWNRDWKTVLQERVAELAGPQPEYRATVTGPEHEQVFTAEVLIGGTPRGVGRGQNKKTAEQNAAREAVFFLRDHPASIG
ncbi:Ribonuclease 3 [Corynebacterium capitovis DSM 44611]|uniref:ribonuclease III n=1 Tax=Corynebacterium capitovis TaxID=131081 RepID=UPI00037B5444|nr:ribonuclease III [Corynebacterium capitovis]WKD57427.1 Ribonuclease 3 [Corynebacterium capitovis DSM 44611]